MLARRAGAAVLILSVIGSQARVVASDRADYFAAADRDDDGFLSLDEYQEWMSYAFRQLDRNGDGVLDPTEQVAPGAPRLTLDELHARQAEQFRRQDRDHDGRLSPAEFLAPPS